MSTYTVETIVRGYHVYQVVWKAAVGQVLPYQRERGNPYVVGYKWRTVAVTPYSAARWLDSSDPRLLLRGVILS